MSFWTTLPKPFYALAPMADVTDAAFRRMVAKYSKAVQKAPLGKVLGSPRPTAGPDHSLKDFSALPLVLWTEQVSCDGMVNARGRERLITDLRFDDSERPILAQFFGSKPENFYECAKLAKELGFDGVDINMGCPVDKITKQKAGACLIIDPVLAREVVAATKEGAAGLPVSVKTRVGYNSINTLEWISELIKAEPAAISIHGRTKKEMSKVPAHWDEIAKAAELIHNSGKNILCIGNGDVRNIVEAEEKAKESGVDGVMIGRGLFGNPWLFNKTVSRDSLSYEERARVMLEHAKLFEELYTRPTLPAASVAGGRAGLKPFAIMRKHFGSYMSGHPEAKELKVALMETQNTADTEEVLKRFGLMV